jgi:hypothetical protein
MLAVETEGINSIPSSVLLAGRAASTLDTVHKSERLVASAANAAVAPVRAARAVSDD